MRRKHAAIGLTAIVGTLGGLVTVWIQLDKYLLERAQILRQAEYEKAVMDCEQGGGKWFRGDCVPRGTP